MTAEERRTARDEAARAAAELQTTPPETVEHTLFFDDWRETGGVRFPHTMRRASGGTTTEEWIVTRVRINPRIDSKKFAG
jgi:hypothetical protein